jgi:hypothetical protein
VLLALTTNFERVLLTSCSFVQALRSCTSLRWLNLAHNSLADLDGLQDLTTLNVSTPAILLLLGEAFHQCGGGMPSATFEAAGLVLMGGG